MSLYSCAIISHRPNRFKWKYKENNNGCKRLKKRVNEQIVALYEQGVRRFLVGGGLGIDQWVGEMILRLKEQPEYGDISLVVVLPYSGHDQQWDVRSKDRLAFLIRHSSETVTIGRSERISSALFRIRDKYMIDCADFVLAVYDNNRVIKNQVGAAVQYAESKGIPIVFVHPDNGLIKFTDAIFKCLP